MAYPDWVLKYKKKGTYVNKVGDKYYLYAAHSEHIPGTANKSRRVCDGYLGSITEKDGFIPRKPKVSNEQMISLEAGLSCCIVCACSNAFDHIANVYPKKWKQIVIIATLKYIYDESFDSLKCCSFLSLALKNISLNPSESLEVERLVRLIESTMRKYFKEDDEMTYFKLLMSSWHMVKVKDDWFKPLLNEYQTQILKMMKIDDFTENKLWQKLSMKMSKK